MARKRGVSTFNLSFLDIMSCGFGAVILVFLIIKHETDTQVETKNQEELAEVRLLEEEIKIGEENLVMARNTISAIDDQLATAQGLARRINNRIDAVRGQLADLDDSDTDQQIKLLQAQLKTLEEEKEKLEEEAEAQGSNVREHIGQGDRQYLTGLNLGGDRVLILLDNSSSMLDSSIVNIIRRRHMSDAIKRSSKKWQRAVATVEWLTTQFPVGSHFQIFTFNEQTQPLLSDTAGQWLEVADPTQLEANVLALRKVIPNGGTNLAEAFLAMGQLSPLPDNIFLITDGLPTRGLSRPRQNTVSGAERLELYHRAMEQLPNGIPVNVILAPMEGDPMAAAAFWQLAQTTQGSFLSPSKDWP